MSGFARPPCPPTRESPRRRPPPWLVLAAVGLAVILVFTLAARLRHRQLAIQLVTELQAHAAGFEQHRRTEGAWPARVEDVPAVQSDPAWSRGSPVGGRYGWVPPGRDGRPGQVTVTAFVPDFPLDLSAADLRWLDARFDDGDLRTGRLRAGFNGWPVYLVAEQP